MMHRFVAHRFVSSLITMALASIVVFLSIHLLPGDPVVMVLGEQAGADPMAVARVRAELGLDLPLPTQFVRWASAVLHGDLGHSLRSGEPVVAELARRIPRSLEIIFGGLVAAVVFGIPLGTIAARDRGRVSGLIASIVAIAGFSAPVFVSGIILVLIFSLWLGLLPSSGYVALDDDPLTHFACLVLPCVAIGINFMGVVARMTRSSLIDTLSKDYVRMARAKGLTRGQAMTRHALPNALVPVIAIVGIRAGNLLGGTVIVEALFDWPGLSSLLVSACFARDYPVMQGCLLSIFAIFIVISLLIDIAQSIVDPRVRTGTK